MKCPICQQVMNLNKEDISFRNDGKEYKRRMYECTSDDTWIVVETPKNSNVA